MRPIKLEMSAFLSYGEKQTIDFTELGKNGLYLITGDTGAGKTTIFDAITYALYGESSGGMRDGKMLRSKYADPDAETYVELTFECNGKEYVVRRSPEYERTKKRGTGTTKSPADAALTYPDGRNPITKIDDVTKGVVEIIGLTKDQFSQIAMIAQGQFRELLVADTKVRIEIFRHIFETGNYEKLQNRIAEDFRNENDIQENIKNTIKNEIDHIVTEDENVQFNKEKVGDKDFLNNEIIVPLAELVEKDRKVQKQAEIKNQTLQKEKEKAAANVSRAEMLEVNMRSLDKKTEERNKVKAELAEASEKLNKANSFKEKIDSLKNEAAGEEKTLAQYEQLENDRTQLKEEQKRKETCDKLIEEYKNEIENSDKQLKKYEEEINRLNNVDVDIEKLKQEKADADKKIRKCTDICARFEQERKYGKEIEKKAKECLASEAEVKRLEEIYHLINEKYLSGFAGRLAMDLRPGMPCPVCGSVNHIKLAVLMDDDVTKEDVEKAGEDAEKQKKHSTELEKALESIKGTAETYKAETRRQAEEYVTAENFENAEELLKKIIADEQQNIKVLNEKLDTLQIEKKRYDELNGNIPLLRKKINARNNELTYKTAENAAHSATIDQLEKNIKKLSESLKYAGKAEAEKEIKKLRNEAKNLTDAIDKAQKDYETSNNKMTGLEGEITSLKEQIEKSEKLNLTEQKKNLEDINEQIKENEEKNKKVNHRLTNNVEVLNNIKNNLDNMEKNSSRYGWLKNLNDTVSGKNIDKNGKIMLETYIQQAYFDRIVNKANKRFTKMSQNRYELNRIREATGNQAQSGLDLEIIDKYNSSRRSVKSLSGGEQFEASLSLALGLSDMVQESSAGVKLDCMFIDEGFGSLDEEALNHALSALKDLSDGNRLVGIISHVKELEREIDKQIVVTKDARGFSRAKIKND